MKPTLTLTLAAIVFGVLGTEVRAQERSTFREGAYDRASDYVESRHYRRDRIQEEVRELNNLLARVRAELRRYGGGRQVRYQFARVERQVDHLNAQFRSGRYDRDHVRQELAQLESSLHRLSADIRDRDDRSGYAERDSRSGYLEYHPTRIQRALATRGYYHGPIDGDLGSGTTRAIIRFQIDRGVRGTGRVDSELLRLLGIQ